MSTGQRKHLKGFSSFVDLVVERASQRPDKRVFTFLANGKDEAACLSFSEVDRRARAIASMLQQEGKAGQPVLLLYPPGLDFVEGFLGCLYAGAVAVPAYPPETSRTLGRLQAILEDAQAGGILSTREIRRQLQQLPIDVPQIKKLPCWASELIPDSAANDWQPPTLDRDSLAFLQYTSGSTAAPKGVMVSHGNLLHNEEMIRTATHHTSELVMVGWLPLYHDMGLIGKVLQPLAVGGASVLMSPLAFLRRPIRWLRAISKYRGTTSGGPNFAYDLCVFKTRQDEREGLDLSCWQVAFNGAEPVRADSLALFAKAFAPYGFRPQSFYPCYGLAEATLLVSGADPGQPAPIRHLDAAALEQHRIVPEMAGTASKRLVSCGRSWLEQKIRIVDPETGKICLNDRIGEIWVSGSSVARGYWRRPELSDVTFRARLTDRDEGPFLRTGDLGFLDGDRLYVTGRLKDLIILRGRNYYPQDIELVAERSHRALRPSCGAAFSVEIDDREQLVVVYEVRPDQEWDLEQVAAAIRQAVSQSEELQVYEVVLLAAREIPKTSSGKIQRRACREMLLEGKLNVCGRSTLTGDPSDFTVESLTTPPQTSAERQPGDWLSLEPEQRRRAVEAGLLSCVAEVTQGPPEGDKWGVPPPRVRLDHTLSRLGLDSLMAVELQHCIESNLGIEVSLSRLLERPALSDLVDEISKSPRSLAHERKAPVVKERPGDHPLSIGQQALWFVEHLAPGSAAYNLAGAARLRQAPDVAALRRALETLSDRHPALRTTFPTHEGHSVRRIHAAFPVPFSRIEADGWSEPKVDRWLVEEAYRPFVFEREPPLRVMLLQCPSDDLLLFVFHHLVVDFWSLEVLLRELGLLYRQQIGGPPAELPPPGLDYGDYIAEQERYLASAASERDWTYWRQTLRSATTELDLPTDRLRPAVKTFRGASRGLSPDAELTTDIRRLAHQQGATVYTTLLAAFDVLLYRYSGQDDLLVGSPMAQRASAGRRNLVGYLVNPVVLHAELSGDPSFQEFLGQTRQTVIAAIKHQSLPFPVLAERLHPSPDPSRSPLFQVMFVLQKAHLPGMAALAAFALGRAGGALDLEGDLSLEPRPLSECRSQFDLMLMASETDQEIDFSFQYTTDLFDATTIHRMAEHWRVLLAGIVADPSRRLGDFALLTPAERSQIFLEWNDSGRPAADAGGPRATCLHGLIETQVERTPDAVAVVFEDWSLSYRELNRRANQLAHLLRSRGVGPDVAVGLCAERSLELVVGLVGILKAGGAYVPLDPSYPRERLASMLEDARPPVLLTQERLATALPACPGAVIRLDTDWPLLAAESGESPPWHGDAANLVYTIFTSGSTGRPKGAMNSHRAIVNRILWMQEAYGLETADRVLQKTPFSFDVSVWEFFWPLVTGARLVVLRPEGHQDAAHLVRRVVEEKITTLHFVPSMLQVFVEQPEVEACRSLRRVIASGEALPFDLKRRFFSRLESELHNLYGPTEAAVDVTFHRCERHPSSPLVPIGRPISNLRIHVLDRALRPVPEGVTGQLHIAGMGLARGYLVRPGLTAEQFIPDPLSPQPGERLYQTGDLARHLPNGAVDYLGRLDFQVKIRGFRIEPGEIEARLVELPEVREAVVVAGDQRLIAYVVAKEEPASTAEESRRLSLGALRSALAQRLPGYMVPQSWVFLEALPRLPNGKLDRRRLPVPESQRPALRIAYVAPRDAVEDTVARLWAELLGVDKVGIHDNFFELGGHSLLITRLISRIQQIFGVAPAFGVLYEEPTVARLSAAVARGRTARGRPQAPISRSRRRLRLDGEPCATFPLSFAQERLWFLERLSPGESVYHIPAVLRLHGGLKIDALRRSLEEIVARHEALRMAFMENGGDPVQRLLPELSLSVPVVDLSRLPPAERAAAVGHHALRCGREPFDLARPPLLRVALLHIGDDDHVFLLTMHHLISDGWSLGALVREFAALYHAFSRGERSPLDAIEIQYPDFVDWQRQGLRGEELERQLSFWKEYLRGPLPELRLPTDHPRPAELSAAGSRFSWMLPAALTEQVEALARRSGLTLFGVLLAAFKTLLHRYTGELDVLVGVLSAGRNRAELQDLIGFFVNTVVLRTDLSGEPGVGELLQRIRDTAARAFEHDEMPFAGLIEELQPERELGRNPLFQVMFTFQNAGLFELELPELELNAEEIDLGTAKFELVLEINAGASGLEGQLEYSTELFDRSTIRRMRTHYERLLAAMVEDPRRRVGELCLLSGSEQHQLLAEWNDTRRRLPGGECLPDRLAARARLDPTAAAVFSEQGRLTYGELEHRSGQLAGTLRSLGVRPESLVGLVLHRNPQALVAMLATLKAGGAYLPVDPSIPARRLATILEDSGCRIVLSEEKLRSKLPSSGPPGMAARTVWLEEALSAAGEPAPRSRWRRRSAGPDHLVSPDPQASASPDNLAFVIYTSGSTGRPKGVQVTHRGLINVARAFRGAYRLEPGDRVLQFASLSFDLAAEEIFPTWLGGATVVMAPARLDASYDELVRFARAQRVSVLNLPGSYWHGLVEEVAAGRLEIPARVRLMIVGAEAVSPRKLEAWQRLVGRPIEVLNCYGPTETTIVSTIYRPAALARRVGLGVTLPIGRPFPNTEVYVLDRRLRSVAAGVAGELAIGGHGVSRGYLSRAGLTARRFVPDALSGAPGGRLYLSGDQGRRLADGTIEFLGRVDHQVKIRGFRVELGEIESLLERHPAVREVAVRAMSMGNDSSGPGETRLVAYVALWPQRHDTLAGVKSHLREQLPYYMVPSSFLRLDRLPRLPSGKVDRRSLPEPESWSADAAGFVAPRGAIEESLAALWSQLLGVERIGAQDSFFELGGHSLLMAKLSSRVRDQLGVELPLRRLFERPVLADLAAAIAEAREREAPRAALTTTPVAALTIAPVARPDGRLPASFAQRRLWFLEQLEGLRSVYNVADAFAVGGAFEPEMWDRALTEIRRRHEVLRTTFTLAGGEPVQVIGEPTPVISPVVDLSALAAPERDAESGRWGAWEARRAFDLELGPLLRSTLLRRAAEDWVILLTQHHIVTDGWSTGIFLGDLQVLYRAFAAGRESPLPELPVQYGDFAVWQRDLLQGEVLESDLAYWRGQLGDPPPPLELPSDRPRLPLPTFRGNTVTAFFDGELLRRSAHLGQQRGVTLFMTLLAAFQALLGRCSGQKDFCVGSAISGRNHTEIEGLIGFFVNTVVLRADLRRNPNFHALLDRARTTVIEAQSHQEIPFELLVEKLEPARDLSRTPFFQVMLILEDVEIPTFDLPDIDFELLETHRRTAEFDLTLSLRETGGGLEAHLEYATDLYDATTARRLLEQFRQLLAAATAAPERPVGELSLLGRGATHQLLVEWNRPADLVPATGLHQLFEARAASAPDACALICGDLHLSYHHLDEQAGRLAGGLRELGVGPEALVGISMERCANLVTAVLGVLKAGGAYLPLDPAFPAERLGFLREDSGARRVLTRKTVAELCREPATSPRSADASSTDGSSMDAGSTGGSHLAYVLYTSGTTGRPKGVTVTHQSAVSFLESMREAPGLEAGDKLLAVTTLSFDIHVLELFLPLTTGATVVLATRAEAADGRRLRRLLRDVDVLQATPSTWRLLLEAGWSPGETPGLRRLCGGEALPRELAERLLERTPELWNLYGPTETTVWSAIHRVGPGPIRGGPIRVGRPIARTSIYVVDRNGHPVPAGVVGELVIGGAGLARSYQGRPGLTAEKFVPDGLGPSAGGRLYRSGDLARSLPSGELDVLGRIDHQVKVRGFRIEPGEIEARLAERPDVREAVVVARAQRLVAYVVTGHPKAPSVSFLRGALGRKLPDYMVPQSWVFLEALPRLPNGKIDRRRLPAPDGERPELDKPYVAPRDEVEETLAALWAEYLGVEKVGIHDNFFELGGHSLLIVRLVSRIQEIFGFVPSIGTLYLDPTVARLSTVVSERRAAKKPQQPSIPRSRRRRRSA